MYLFTISGSFISTVLGLYNALNNEKSFFRIVLWINRYKNHKFDLNHHKPLSYAI